MNRRTFLKTTLVGAVALSATVAPSGFASAQSQNIVQIAAGNPDFSTLVAAVTAAGLADTLSGPGPFTVFAPTNAAFAKLPAGTVDTLLKPENKQQLIDILTYHVIAGRVQAADVVKLTSAKTVNGAEVKITVNGSNVMVDNANVTATDILASNGVIHVIDTVIIPQAAPTPVMPPTGAAAQAAADIVDTAVGAGDFKTLVAAVTAAGLVDTLKGPGPFTVFAPNDAAFAKLPAGTIDNLLKPENKQQLVDILTYHVVAGRVLAVDVVNLTSAKTVNGAEVKIAVSGGAVKVNDSNVIATDVLASNGVIHVIDAVLLPPAPVMPPTGAAAQGDKDIVDTAVGAGDFKTLAAALTAAGLVDTLKGAGPFTVFAPTDAAFAKLDKMTLEELLKPANKVKLTAILTYHVVPGKVTAADVVKLTSAKTVQGEEIKIAVKDGKVMVDNANVVATDVMASNGVIHVIDSVIMPPSMANTQMQPQVLPPAPAKPMNIVDTAVGAGNFNTLTAALQAAGLVNTLKGGRWTVFAPTDEAFAKLPAGTVENLLKPENKNTLRDILLYHVTRGALDAATVTKHSGVTMANGVRAPIAVADGKATIGGSTITATDIKATNGIIHVIDTVILPPGNLAEVAEKAGAFSTLLAAVKAAGLEKDLVTLGRQPLTILAPTDEAFAKLPAGTVESLLKPENKATLRRILLNHIIRGSVDSTAVSKLTSARTLAGTRLPVKAADGKVMIGDATVTAADVIARNGIIHVIDTVLVP
jgi:transforming growth factor-beta-induced protein